MRGEILIHGQLPTGGGPSNLPRRVGPPNIRPRFLTQVGQPIINLQSEESNSTATVSRSGQPMKASIRFLATGVQKVAHWSGTDTPFLDAALLKDGIMRQRAVSTTLSKEALEQARILRDLASSLRSQNKLKDVLKAIQKATDLIEELHLKNNSIEVLGALAGTQAVHADILNALDLKHRALVLYIATSDTYNKAAEKALEAGDVPAARRYYHEAYCACVAQSSIAEGIREFAYALVVQSKAEQMLLLERDPDLGKPAQKTG